MTLVITHIFSFKKVSLISETSNLFQDSIFYIIKIKPVRNIVQRNMIYRGIKEAVIALTFDGPLLR